MRIGVTVVLLLVFLFIDFAEARGVSVRGYYRRDGTYVRPHVRSSPDRYRWNNYGPSRSDAELMNGALRDADGDGIPNGQDFDDDNDGIADDRDATQYGYALPGQAIAKPPTSVPPSPQRCYPGYREVAGVCTMAQPAEPGLASRQPGMTPSVSSDGCPSGMVRFHGRCTALEVEPGGSVEHTPPNLAATTPASNPNYGGLCRSGAVLFNGQCTNIESGSTSETEPGSRALASSICESDHHWDGSTCAYGPPPHGTQNALNSAWTCDFGYERTGSTCVAIALPANARFTFLGRGWKCNFGFERNGDVCARASSASESRIGPSGTCPPGTRRIGVRCRRS